MSVIVQGTAQQVLEVVPLVMRTIRAKLRRHRTADINVPQFRALAYINRNEGASLSDLADHIGLTLPSMSKLIDGLVSRKLVNRTAHSSDRRRMCLSLTAQGREELKASFRHTEKYLTDILSDVTEEELETISHTMQVLRELFLHEPEEEPVLQAER